MKSIHRKSTHILNILAIIYVTILRVSEAESECTQRLNNCTVMVRPYLNDLRYMFPTNLEDVDEMCRMWSQFVDCVRRYVSHCFSEERKLLFHKSVENSVDTVHAICSSEHFQKDYLSKAVCFKRISIDNCGQYYKQLIEHVSNPRAHDDHICCSYGQFKNCVNDPLLRECGRRARSLMDHSMGFLISRCAHLNLDRLSDRCPTPVEPFISIISTTTTIPTTTEEPFDEDNDVSNRARSDRSYDTETEPSSNNWSPRTVVYTLPPEPGSQTSSARLLFNRKLTGILCKSLFSCLIALLFGKIQIN